MRRFSETHEWIDDQTGKVGLSTYAQNELGDIVYLQLPAVGKKISAGEELVIVESTKAAADIYSPVSGRVVEVNDQAALDPSIVNRSAEEEGWLVRIEIAESKEFEQLLSYEQYQLLVQQQTSS